MIKNYRLTKAEQEQQQTVVRAEIVTYPQHRLSNNPQSSTVKTTVCAIQWYVKHSTYIKNKTHTHIIFKKYIKVKYFYYYSFIIRQLDIGHEIIFWFVNEIITFTEWLSLK